MRTLTFARNRGEFAGSVSCRAARKPRRWRLRAMPGVLICAAIFSNPAAADRLRNGMRAFAAHDYVTAARIFSDLAPLGNAKAQTYPRLHVRHWQGRAAKFYGVRGMVPLRQSTRSSNGAVHAWAHV